MKTRSNVHFKALTSQQVVLFPSNIGDRISSDHPVRIVNQSADFVNIYNTAKVGLAALSNNAGRVLGNFSLIHTAAGQMTLRVNYTNSAGSAFVANFTYNVITDANGAISLEQTAVDGNAGVIAPAIVALTNYLTQNKFVCKWYYSPDFQKEYIGLQKSTDPASFFFGVYGN